MSESFNQLIAELGAKVSSSFEHLPPVQNLAMEELAAQNITLDCFRLDLAHPRVSGNKWYKLKHHLAEVQKTGCQHVVSFGGAYSNHLHALSYAAHQLQLELTVLVRGEPAEALTPTLQDCKSWGAKIIWVPRSDYAFMSRAENISTVREQFPDAYVIPEGGEGVQGVLGVYELFQKLQQMHDRYYDMWVSSVGSGTTLAGMRMAVPKHTELVGFSALKGAFDLEHRVEQAFSSARSSVSDVEDHISMQICHDYHFGGFAKMPERLTQFISALHSKTGVLFDPVYTGKAMFGLMEWIHHKRLRAGSKVLFVHTGGLQGWRGLSSS